MIAQQGGEYQPCYLEGHLDRGGDGVVAAAVRLQQLALELLYEVFVVRELKKFLELLAGLNM